MPELPEVKTIVDDLNKKVSGNIITDFWSDWPKSIKSSSLKEFRKGVSGRKILKIERIGKNIFFNLSGGKTVYIHLKMTGHLLVKHKKSSKKERKYFKEKVNQYIHHIFHLGKNLAIEFSDLRKFGKIILEDTEKIKNISEIKKLGIDAINPKFDFKKFNEILEAKDKNKIGILLLNQELISGIGNIYRSEILFEAGVNPLKEAGKISNEKRKKLYQSIKKVLKRAIKMRGTSDSDYRDTSGAPGEFQKVLKVYRRNGKKCKKCGTMVKRLKIGQRSVFYCPKCQK